MRTIDTNIVVRLIARDDPKQLVTATGVVASDFLLIPTVILEAVWTLDTVYRFDRSRIVSELRTVIALDTATTVSQSSIEWALERFEAGADFGDMLHVVLAWLHGGTSFATFDKKIARHVGTDQLPVETLT